MDETKIHIPDPLRLSDLLSQDRASVPSYMGDGVLPIGGRLLLSGPAGLGKSIIVSNIAYDLAAGWNPLGQPLLRVEHPINVLYVENEIGEDGLRVRFGKLHSLKRSGEAAKNLSVLSRSGLLFKVGQGGAKWERAVPKEWLRIFEKVRPSVVVGDPLATLHTVEENDNSQMKEVVDGIDELTAAAKAELDLDLSWIIVHHYRKRSKDELLNMNLVRGASRLVDWADTRCLLDYKDRLKGPDGVEHHYRLLNWAVVRQGPSIPDMFLWIDPCTLVPVVNFTRQPEEGCPFG